MVAQLAKQRRQWHPTPVLLPGKSHGQRSLVGCHPWGHEELDMAERLHFHCLLSCIGGGNGNLLQYSCLENPRDRGAWWAVVYGVTQSRTWLKRLSSSSSERKLLDCTWAKLEPSIRFSEKKTVTDSSEWKILHHHLGKPVPSQLLLISSGI